MKIINQSVELVDDINGAEVLKKIEKCGRVCYQSMPRENGAEQFVRMLIKRGHESVLEHVSLTFHIVCDRGILAELTRHRLASFSVESTRFVKYNELTFIEPPFCKRDAVAEMFFLTIAGTLESQYRKFVESGMKPEQARALLPLSLKTELYMTANLREWRHILKLRCAKAAHPQMRKIMYQILDIFKEKLPVIVEDFDE